MNKNHLLSLFLISAASQSLFRAESINNSSETPTNTSDSMASTTPTTPTQVPIPPLTSPLLTALNNADIAIGIVPSTGPFDLPPLEYDYDALEPYIDEATLRVHHLGHHKTYVDNLNALLARHPQFYDYTLEQLLIFSDRLPSDIKTPLINNAGGHYNHSLTWKLLSPPNTESSPEGEFGEVLNRQFGSFENFKDAFKAAGLSVFGSGYAWLVLNPYGRLQIVTTSNQNTPLPLRTVPLLPLDVWEHAYYLKHQNDREAYIDDYFNLINWDRVGARYTAALQAQS